MIRLFDLVISLILLIFFIPLFFFLGLLVVIDSPGPILYMQKRVGKGGTGFNLYKFRSMFVESDKKGLITVSDRDPRITRSGYLMRKYKLDELPQLFNVIMGQMSLVGPRPEVMKYVSLYTCEQKEILAIKPGITDYASIIFRNENEILSQQSNPEEYYISNILPYKVNLNKIFVRNRNLSEYFTVLVFTFLIETKFPCSSIEKIIINKLNKSRDN